MAQKKKLSKDTNKKAKSEVDLATGEKEETTIDGKNAAAVELGRKSGKAGGPARAAPLSAKRRKEIAKKAVAARWGASNK
ncbi:MAG: hypothetical protein H7Y42_12570 [Chitinophagaceae bacterium]|nr:hypothetical protein [Chitinophagaceae bacterium]